MSQQEMIEFRPQLKAHLIEIGLEERLTLAVLRAHDKATKKAELLECVSCKTTKLRADVNKKRGGVPMCYSCRLIEDYFEGKVEYL